MVVGFAGGTIPSIPANILLLKNISALGLFWGRYRDEEFPLFSSTISSALSYYQEGQIQPHIGGVFKLEEVRRRSLTLTVLKLLQNFLDCPMDNLYNNERKALMKLGE